MNNKNTKLIQLSDDFIVNLAIVYSVQGLVTQNPKYVEWFADYTEKVNDEYKQYLTSLGLNGDEHLPEEEEKQLDIEYEKISQNVLNTIGKRPDETIYSFIVTLTTGKQVKITQQLFNMFSTLSSECFVHLSKNFIINLSTIGTLQRMKYQNQDAIVWQKQYDDETSELTYKYLTKYGLTGDTTVEDLDDEEFVESLCDYVKTNTAWMGEKPPEYKYQYIVTLTSGKQVGVDETIFNAIKNLID